MAGMRVLAAFLVAILLQTAPATAAEPAPDPVERFAQALDAEARTAFRALAAGEQRRMAQTCPAQQCLEAIGALQHQDRRFVRKARKCLDNGACSAALRRLGAHHTSIYNMAAINGLPAEVWKPVRACGSSERCIAGVLAEARKDKFLSIRGGLDEGLVLCAMLSSRIGATDYVMVLARLVRTIGAANASDILELST